MSRTVRRRHNKDGSVTTTTSISRKGLFGTRYVDTYSERSKPNTSPQNTQQQRSAFVTLYFLLLVIPTIVLSFIEWIIFRKINGFMISSFCLFVPSWILGIYLLFRNRRKDSTDTVQMESRISTEEIKTNVAQTNITDPQHQPIVKTENNTDFSQIQSEADLICQRIEMSIRNQKSAQENADITQQQSIAAKESNTDLSQIPPQSDLNERAIYWAVNADNSEVTVSYFQRKMKLGYSRAARLTEELQSLGIIGPFINAAPRKVFMTKEQYEKRTAAFGIEVSEVNFSALSHTPIQSDSRNITKNSLNENESIDKLLSQLDELTGLAEVKKEVRSLINLIQVQKEREKKGLTVIPISKHLVFSGNPGTGKTTVARLLAQIYKSLGVIPNGQLIEVDRSGLVGGYVGQTAIKTQEVINKAMGGVLFIDEAYTLSGKGEGDFGQEAIDTLLKAMEDKRDQFVVIAAGYPDLMSSFLESNPGLKSRFNRFMTFEDYNSDELMEIFTKMCQKSGYTLSDDAVEYASVYLSNIYENRTSNFANARDVRNFFENAVVNQANRLSENKDFSSDALTKLITDDLKK